MRFTHALASLVHNSWKSVLPACFLSPPEKLHIAQDVNNLIHALEGIYSGDVFFFIALDQLRPFLSIFDRDSKFVNEHVTCA